MSPDAKEFGQVVELAVNVAADCDGSGDGLDVRFFTEYFFGLLVGRVGGVRETMEEGKGGWLGCKKVALETKMFIGICLHHCDY